MIMKKFINILLLLVMVTMSAAAQSQFWVNGVHYEATSTNSVKVIAANADTYSGVINIPETVNCEVFYLSTDVYGEVGERICVVTEVDDDAFHGCEGLTQVVLPKSITRIGKNAFYGCSSLNMLEIPHGVTTIGASAFAYCTALTSVTLPNSVTNLDWNVFYGCSSLSSVTLSMSLNALNGTFHGCTSLTSIDIPAGVTRIDGAFDGCTALASVNMPRSLYYIGDETFEGCSALTSIDLPNSVEYIGNLAFAGSGLTSLALPSSVGHVGENAFYCCTALNDVSVRAANPPLMANSDVFSPETYGLATLYVPEVTLASYHAADWWHQFEHMMGNAALNTPYDFEAAGIYYIITGNATVEVTFKDQGYNSYSGAVTIPASVTHDGVTYQVTGVGNSAFRGCAALTNVNLPAGLTHIGRLAFCGAAVSGLEIPQTVTAIGDSAFYSSTGLTALTIPENVAVIGTDAFGGVAVQSLTWNARHCMSNGNMVTDQITQLNIGDEVTVLPDRFAYGARIMTVNLPTSLEIIGAEAFKNVRLTSLTIPVNVRTIGLFAFEGNYVSTMVWNARECWNVGYQNYYSFGVGLFSSLQELVIGDEVQVLPYAIAKGSGITSVTLPSSLKHIGAFAFADCTHLTSIVVPDQVETIGDYAFAFSSASSIVIGKGVTIIGSCALDVSCPMDLTWNATRCETMSLFHVESTAGFIQKVTIGDNVEKIPNYFAYHSSVNEVVIPASVKEIGRYAFAECYALTDVSIPGSVNSIGECAFHSCNALEVVDIPYSVKTIGDEAFSYCKSLTDVTIAAASIGARAFACCGNLKQLALLPCVERIGVAAFNSCSKLTELSIPATVRFIDEYAFTSCTGLESIVVDAANQIYDSHGNCNAVIETATGTVLIVCKNTTLPDGVTSIADYAFSGRTDLTSIDLPETVTSIGASAFSGCTSLTSISIPEGVTSIGAYAFYGCKGLTSFTFPDSLKELGVQAFFNCSGLEHVDFGNCTAPINASVFTGCSALSSVAVNENNAVYDDREDCNALIRTDDNTLLIGTNRTVIPASVTAIGSSAFSSRTGLTAITIPASVRLIDSDAFYGCTGLTRVDIADINDWFNLSFATGLANPLYYAHHLYADGNEVTDVVFPEGATEVKNHIFYGCKGIKTVEFPSTVKYISKAAFCYCSGLKSVVIPDSVVSVSSYAFAYCDSLTSVTIGSSVNYLAEYAFYYSSKVNDVTCRAVTPPYMPYYNTFDSNAYKGILRVPQQSVNAYKSEYYWRDFKTIEGIELQQTLAGCDVNGDGVVNISDVTSLINVLLSGQKRSASSGDVDGDGKTGISDVTTLINLLLNGE